MMNTIKRKRKSRRTKSTFPEVNIPFRVKFTAKRFKSWITYNLSLLKVYNLRIISGYIK